MQASQRSPVARNLSRATWALFACAALLYISAEIVGFFGLERISKIHGRIRSEGREAQQIRSAAPGKPKTILFVGNSLVQEGVNFPALKQDVSIKFDATRYIVEGTGYYDWYYALRRLFRHAAHPDFVVLSLNPSGLLTDNTRGDFAARFLWDVQDLWPLSRDIHADLSTTSGLYLAHFSTFYATRNVLRAVFMGKVAPAIPVMWRISVFSLAVEPPDSVAIPIMRDRLAALKRLCEANGTGVSFLIPPTPQLGDTAIVAAGEQSGVRVLRPIPNFSLGPEYYQDGLHLNDKGAEKFTKSVEQILLDSSFQ
jgi:hypothetical protein